MITAIDELIRRVSFLPPLAGLVEDLDPTLSDDQYLPSFAPDLENIRVSQGVWQTRLGMSLYKATIGSGDVRWLSNTYLSNGKRMRLLARGTGTGAVLYDLEQGVDTVWQATSGGTGLGGASYSAFQGVTLNDSVYFTDRQGALRKYVESAGTQVAAVTQPVAPSTLPGARARPAGYLDPWQGGAPFGWTESDVANFFTTEVSAATPAPSAGFVNGINIAGAGAISDTISDNVSNEAVNSETVAFWYRQSRAAQCITFELGLTSAGDLVSLPLKAPTKDEWYPKFISVAGVATCNFKRFKCMTATAGIDYFSQLLLPGRLSGQYRWVYTHYDPATKRESEPSPISNSALPLDFTAVGVSDNRNTTQAMNKACVLTFTSDSGADSSTTKIRIYRNGGTEKLTKDDLGNDVWFKVGEVFDKATTLNGAVLAGDQVITVTSATSMAVGDTLVINKGTTTEETVTITSVVGAIFGITPSLAYGHASGQAVQIAFLDNVPNTQVDVSTKVDLERDDPPAAARYLSVAPDGRIWLFNTSGSPTGVAVSNKPTPLRPTDYEVFPDGVDPLTRRDGIQGWRFEVGGDITDEEIVWGGHFRGRPVILTKRNLYVINAQNQTQWGPDAVQKAFAVGCIAGDTVKECNGILYWVAPGPTLVRWDGSLAGQVNARGPEVISHQRISSRLSSASSSSWADWFAIYHPMRDGHYYRLYFQPTGASSNTQRLDYNIDQNAWEPVVYYNSSAVAYGWRGAVVLDGGSDSRELYQVDTTGVSYQAETGLTDNGAAIRIRFATKKYPLDVTAMLHDFFMRLSAFTDSVTVTVTTGGSEYAQTSQSFTLSLAGTNEIQLKRRLLRTLLGRWVQVSVSGSVVNRPAIREMEVRWLTHRVGGYTT